MNTLPLLKWQDMTNADYHNSPAHGSTDMKLMLQSPAHYKAKEAFADTDTTQFGSAFHALILEGEPALNKGWEILADGIRSAKRKEEAAERGVYLLTPDHGKDLFKMRKAIEATEDARKLLALDGPCEKSGFWQDTETGLYCKIRPDKLIPSAGIIMDLKTFTLQAEYNLEVNFKKQFSKAIWSRRYDIQAAYYLDGASMIDNKDYHTFVWIVITKEAPFMVGVWIADNTMLTMGRKAYREQLKRFKHCYDTNEWPLPDIGGISAIGLPEWVLTNNFKEEVIYD